MLCSAEQKGFGACSVKLLLVVTIRTLTASVQFQRKKRSTMYGIVYVFRSIHQSEIRHLVASKIDQKSATATQ